MEDNLPTPAQWSEHQFGSAQLGDRRRTKRLVKVAASLAANPSGTLPQALTNWAELKAAYRLMDAPGATFENVIAPHLAHTRAALREPGEYLIIEDTTLLDYTSHHPATEDLGVIGDGQGRGLELHSALAVRVEGWTVEARPEGTVAGLFGQQCRRPRPAPKNESRRARLSRWRKSLDWAAAFEEAGGPPEGCRWIYIADRESDFWEPMQRTLARGGDFVIRAVHDRRLADQAGHLQEALANAPVLGQLTVELRARPGQPARTAMVEVRRVRVDLDGPWRPVGGWQEPLRGLWAVEVREVHAPPGVKEPLHWVLLTSLECQSWEQVRRVIGRYAARWWVEEYHKALKSGTHVQASQLERAYRLEPLIGILAVVAVRLLCTKLLARSRPDSFEALESFAPEMIQILERKLGRPKGGWTNKNLLVATARMGGFLARKNDGMPGWQTIWRGWQRLIWMSEGLEILNEWPTKCG
jgi:hypothetical protein